jgi:secreted PhoX family phosphatase
MTTLDRTAFLKRGTVSLAALTAMAGPFGGLVARAANGPKTALQNGGYGPLGPIPEIDSGQVLLHLPEGFQYRVLSRGARGVVAGDLMSDGFTTPGRSDGMGAESWRGRTRLIRNHEILGDPGHFGPAATAYDARSGGGTTTLELTRDNRVAASWTSLNGTNFNCAGGVTPWGSWLTCEETVNGPDANLTFDVPPRLLDLDEKHGYMFEVPFGQGPDELVLREPIRNAGRFAHEAMAVDPATGIVYETEDDFAYWSGLYRYIPPNNPFRDKRVEDGGRLQVLGVVPPGASEPETINLSNGQEVGVTYRVAWIDIEDPDPAIPVGTPNDPAVRTLFQGQAEPQGAAQFSRLEGIDYFGRRMYLVSTEGGKSASGNGSAGFGEGFGQVWVYDINHENLTLLFESPGKDVLDLPDNVVVSPRRKSLLLCEDSTGDNFLRGLTQDGLLFDFALNRFPGALGDEFAGATFSPDTQTLYVNLQATAITYAIWGPWQRGLL